MTNRINRDFPEIDTVDFELRFEKEEEKECFLNNKQEFCDIICRVIEEIGLLGEIEHLTVRASEPKAKGGGCSKIYHERKSGLWPSKRLYLDIYLDRYMDERLLRHEFQHESDRRNKDMDYSCKTEKWWNCSEAKAHAWSLAANICVDARLGELGLGKEFRRENFIKTVGDECVDIFEGAWEKPPETWPEINDLAEKLLPLCPGYRQQITTIGKKRPLTYRRR